MIYDVVPRPPQYASIPRLECQGGKNHFNHCASVATIGGSDFELMLRNTPAISDRGEVEALLTCGGLSATTEDTSMSAIGPPLPTPTDLRQAVKRTRVSICYAAGYAASRGACVTPYPGGDAFTSRPIDIHVRALVAAGADVSSCEGGLSINFRTGPRPFEVDLNGPYGPSLGASVSALLLAATADGTSVLRNISPEPEALAVSRILRSYGVQIKQVDEATVAVEGAGGPLTGRVVDTVEADRSEAITYVLLAAARRLRIDLTGLDLSDLPPPVHTGLEDLGVRLVAQPETPKRVVSVLSEVPPGKSSIVTTGVHPRFPTDMNPVLAAFACLVPGYTEVRERVYRERTSHVNELRKLGLDIAVRAGCQMIRGAQRPKSGVAIVRDVRCGAAIMVAAAAAPGPVRMVDPGGHLARGYSHLARKLAAIGVSIEERGLHESTEHQPS